MIIRLLIPLWILTLLCIASCTDGQAPIVANDAIKTNDPTSMSVGREQHEYGGWYCPDNLTGFPPVDIQQLDMIPVISDRLPTREETQDGRSLMFIDPIKYPYARALDMGLPRLARTYSRNSEGEDLVIIIQAAIIGTDTIVGYRYPAGGNGSGWYDEVTLLTDTEIDAIGPTPYVMTTMTIDATREEVWSSFTKTGYAAELGTAFEEEVLFASKWKAGTHKQLDYRRDNNSAQGLIADMWGAIYMQIDYDRNGYLATEKLLLLPDGENGTRLQLAAGPYPADLALQEERWEEWAEVVKQGSER